MPHYFDASARTPQTTDLPWSRRNHAVHAKRAPYAQWIETAALKPRRADFAYGCIRFAQKVQTRSHPATTALGRALVHAENTDILALAIQAHLKQTKALKFNKKQTNKQTKKNKHIGRDDEA